VTISIRIRLVGVYRTLFGRDSFTVKLDKSVAVGIIIQKIVDPSSEELKRVLIDPELNSPRPNALVLIDGKEISALKGLETELNEDSEVTIIPVSHGG